MTRPASVFFAALIAMPALAARPGGPGGDPGTGPRETPRPSLPSPTPTAPGGEPEVFQECSVDDEGVIRGATSDKQFRHFDRNAQMTDRRLLWTGETVFASEDGSLALASDGEGESQTFKLLRYDYGPQGRVEVPGYPVLPRRPEYFYIISSGRGKSGSRESLAPGAYAFDLDGNPTGHLPGLFTPVAASLSGELLLLREGSGALVLLTFRGRVLWRRHLTEAAGVWNRENAPNVALLENGNVVVAGGTGDGRSGNAELIDGSGQVIRNTPFDIPLSAVSENGRYMAGRRGHLELEVYDFLAGDRVRYEYRVQPISQGYDIHGFEVNDYGWLAVVDSGGRLLIYNASGNLASEPKLGFPPGRLASHWSGRYLELLGAHGLASVEWLTGRVVDRRPAETF